MEGDIYTYGTLAIRLVNALLWTSVVLTILHRDKPVTPLIRRLISTILLFGMWVLVIGGIVPLGFPGEAARMVYTIFTAYAGLIALAIVTSEDPPVK